MLCIAKLLPALLIFFLFYTETYSWNYFFNSKVMDMKSTANLEKIVVVTDHKRDTNGNIISSPWENKLYIFDNSGNKIFEYYDSNYTIYNALLAEKTNLVLIKIVNEDDGFLRLINYTTNTIICDNIAFTGDFSISEDGRYILSNDNSGDVILPAFIYDTVNNSVIYESGYSMSKDVFTAIGTNSLLGDGKYFSTIEHKRSSRTVKLKFFKLLNGNLIFQWAKEGISIPSSFGISASQDCNEIVLIDKIEKKIKVYDKNGNAIGNNYSPLYQGIGSIPETIKMSKDGNVFVCFDRSNVYGGVPHRTVLYCIDKIGTLKWLSPDRANYSGDIYDCNISENGKIVSAVYDDGKMVIYDQNGNQINEIQYYIREGWDFLSWMPYLIGNDTRKLLFNNYNGNTILCMSRYYSIYPRWSPDSTKMLFQTEFGGISARDWTGVLNMENDLNAKCANWSWDGENIVYVSKINGINGIYTKRIAPNAQPQLQISFVGSMESETYPHFSPDGRKILYGANYDGKWHVYEKEKKDTPSPAELGKQLTSGDNSEEINARYSPDGRRIAYAKKVQNANGAWSTWDIYVRDLIEGDEVKITDGGFDELYPCFSPNGREIVFATNSYINPYVNSYSGEWKIWKVILTEQNGRVTGASQPIGLTADLVGMHTMPDWSPNGRSIAYISDQSFFGEIYSRNIEGGLGQTYKITDMTVQLNSFLNRE